MRFGILGYGKVGRIRHEVTAALCPGAIFQFYDIVDGGSESNLQSVIDFADAIYVCTPNHMNADYTIRALRAGKHVFCEKPPAINYERLLDVAEVYSSCQDLVLHYGFNHRQYDSIVKMKTIVESGEHGSILWMRGRYGKAMGDPNTKGWRADPSKSGGGILIDQGIHMLDLMSYFGGPFDLIQSVITNSMWNIPGIEDNAFINLYSTKTNIAASLHSTMISWRHLFSFEILLETGYMALNGLKTPSGSYGDEILTICSDKHDQEIATESRYEFRSNRTWEKEVFQFLDAIGSGSGATNLPDALEVMRLIKEAYRDHR